VGGQGPSDKRTMTKRLLTIILLLGLTKTFACSCAPPSITGSYKGSKIIFIGQYIGPDSIGGIYGLPMELENFEVLKFIKGKRLDIIKKIFEKRPLSKPMVTLLSSKRSSCGFTFAKAKYYIIYASNNYPNRLITTDGCTSTHEIEAEKLNEFLSDSSTTPEIIKLNELVKAEPPNEDNRESDSLENYVPQVLFAETQEKLQKEISKRNIILWITIPTILILLTFIAIRRKK